MNRKEEIENMISFLRNELHEILQAEAELERKKYDGRYFKFRNSYSCPKDDEYWWRYYRVFIDNDRLFASCFETDMYGEIKINPHDNVQRSILENCIEISEEEYTREYERILRFLTYGDK